MAIGQTLSMPATYWTSQGTIKFWPQKIKNYQKASQLWDKAAAAYTSAGASREAKIARDSMKAATAAAKRALGDGVYLHIKAKEQYEGSNNLIKQVNALEKAARNLERLNCGFAQCVN